MAIQYCIYRGDGQGRTFAELNSTQRNGREVKRQFHPDDTAALTWFNLYRDQCQSIPSRVILFRANRMAIETIIAEREGKV